ncbi:MAG: SDR family oxidoreductase [Bacteroidota bacterium]
MSTYFIIGASSGIGKQLAENLAIEGHQVYATYHQHPIENHISIDYHPLNVLDEQIDISFLPESIDGLIYCPGSINLKPFHRISAADFANDYQLQVVGAIKLIQACLSRLKNSPQASILLFSTIAAQQGLNFHSQVASSKGAIEGLTKALAAELAPKIRVNAIAPSLTDTPLATALLNTEQKIEANAQRHPLKRIGTTEDIAQMAAFLLSEKASWISGQIMHVDGGMSSIRT